ncbi:phenylalanine--tRNA ligase subunit beta [Candidatus Woesearchaeota archaeon]|nr:phenylalanine--tRNA ligase subunit beta [Candidatus Woesearchaeota archaeon]
MPTIKFSLKDLQKLVGKKISLEEAAELAEYGKGSFEGYNKEEDEVSIEFGDTNLPYLWSVEGVARLFKGVLGLQKGIPKIEVKKGSYKVIADKSVSDVRPSIAAFVAKGCKVDDYLIKQIVQLQEKLCESYGRRRLKAAIGVYSYDKIRFPVHYKATEPESVKFVPLGFRKEMSQQEILEEHPKGKEYAWILEGKKKYPLLVDDEGKVLSFPPIINSDMTGKVEEGGEHLFVEATGMETEPLLLVMNIMAYALYERGFEIYSVEIEDEGKKVISPSLSKDKIKVSKEQIKKILGLELKNSEIKEMLEKMQYDVTSDKAMASIQIPPYRKDILHPNDVIEDIGISYGYKNIEEKKLMSYTQGETSQMVRFRDTIRELLIGMSFQEAFSPILTNKKILYDDMKTKDFGTVEIKNFMSETYSAVRTWILPQMMNLLSKNKHIEYPQRVFEEGIVTVKKDGEIIDYERVAAVSANENADYTEIRKVLDNIMRMIGAEYEIEETEHSSFIEGRVGRVSVKGKNVAYIGEINPNVIEGHGLEVPVVGMELNLSELFRIL